MNDTPRTDALVKSHPETASLDEMADSYNALLYFARQLERELADYTRRSECGDSRLDWIEQGERILDLEVKITEMQIELDHCRDVAGKVEDVDRENVDLKAKLAETEKDAERYRWLRRNCQYGFEDHDGPQLIHRNEETGSHQNINFREELDAAIDAAKEEEHE